jgi:hypothetical protein
MPSARHPDPAEREKDLLHFSAGACVKAFVAYATLPKGADSSVPLCAHKIARLSRWD